jgi:hypothetical protein
MEMASAHQRISCGTFSTEQTSLYPASQSELPNTWLAISHGYNQRPDRDQLIQHRTSRDEPDQCYLNLRKSVDLIGQLR